MISKHPTESHSASLQFGITIRAWSLVFAADAFVSSRDSLKTINLIALRCRRGNLRVHNPHLHPRPRYQGDPEMLDPWKSGIAGMPLGLLLSFRETIIDSALHDAEKKHLKYVRTAHERHAHSYDGPSFNQCLSGAYLGKLCDACMRCIAPRTDYKVRRHILHLGHTMLNLQQR